MTASKHERTKGPANHIAEAIALLDEIDGMAFGKVDAALNALSGKLLLAQSAHDALAEALEPFAHEARTISDDTPDHHLITFAFTAREFRLAVAALSLAKTEG